MRDHQHTLPRVGQGNIICSLNHPPGQVAVSLCPFRCKVNRVGPALSKHLRVPILHLLPGQAFPQPQVDLLQAVVCTDGQTKQLRNGRCSLVSPSGRAGVNSIKMGIRQFLGKFVCLFNPGGIQGFID